MSFDDFCKCTFREFESICNAWKDMRSGENQDSWERTRIAAAIIIQPHLKKNMPPKQLLPLPWDKKTTKAKTYKDPTLSPDQQRRRFEEVARRLGEEING